MPQITLSLPEVKRLIKFCDDNALTDYFIAKDQGAYIGASKGGDNNCIFYFAGCNPEKDADWWDTARDKFGGDDFGEHLSLANLRATIAKIDAWVAEMQAKGTRYKAPRGICWNVTKTRITSKIV